MAISTKQSSKLDAALQEARLDYNAGRLEHAEQIFRRILKDRPSHPEANTGLGRALKDQGKLRESEAPFRRVIAVTPNSAAAHNELGTVLHAQNKLEEAEAAFRRALVLSPDMVHPHKNLGIVLAASGRLAESFPWFKRHAELAYGRPGVVAGAEQIPLHKVQHDQEQREYLNGGRAVGDGMAHLFRIEEGARVAGQAVRSDARDEIMARWQSTTPQYVVVDNFLTDEALNSIRRFCWGSTIWQGSHAGGYVRAIPEHGFVCPLLLQIDQEFRGVYPGILGQHPLLYWWGFKYDSRKRGTAIHADFAAVNVNLWITADEANLDSESGGLIIWDKPAPLDWGFAQYNGGGQQARDFLVTSGARPLTVPYRANRAVIFNSNLFHETDKISFKDGYLNRRINITMLYGRREDADAEAKARL